jgi:hypothetical protein
MGQVTSTSNYSIDKLVSVKDNNLILNTSVNKLTLNTLKKSYVISMLGCARVGKSTFINALISYIFKEDTYITETSRESTHCTVGIDYICLEYNDIQLIILDCQGLNHADSKNDDKLLSFIYSISNLIVYHDASIVNNQTLNTLTSLCLVAHCVNNNRINAPMLYFRMRDYNLDSDMKKVINETFELQNDQYDNVRKAVQKLFPVIDGLYTESLGKKELKLITDHQYSILYKDDEYNFITCFDTILSNIQLSKCIPIDDLVKHINQTIEQINANMTITFENYDYYTLMINQRFTEYWINVDKSIYNKIMVSKYEKSITECNNTINYISSIIAEFRKIFYDIDEEIVENEIEKFSKELLDYLNEQIEKCHELAQIYIEGKKDSICKNVIKGKINDILTKEIISNFTHIGICQHDIEIFKNQVMLDIKAINLEKDDKCALQKELENKYYEDIKDIFSLKKTSILEDVKPYVKNLDVGMDSSVDKKIVISLKIYNFIVSNLKKSKFSKGITNAINAIKLTKDTMISKCKLTIWIYDYIRHNKLFKVGSGKKVMVPDETIINLFCITDDDPELTFKTFQTYFARLIPKVNSVLSKTKMFDIYMESIFDIIKELDFKYIKYDIYYDTKYQIRAIEQVNDITTLINLLYDCTSTHIDNINMNRLIDKEIHTMYHLFCKSVHDEINSYQSDNLCNTFTHNVMVQHKANIYPNNFISVIFSNLPEYWHLDIPDIIFNHETTDSIKEYNIEYDDSEHNDDSDIKLLTLTEKQFKLFVKKVCAIMNYTENIFDKVLYESYELTYIIDYNNKYGRAIIDRINNASLDNEFMVK